MKKIPKAIYQTADEIDARIRTREDEAMLVAPDTDEHRAIMKEIAQLRVYSEAKRWMEKPNVRADRLDASDRQISPAGIVK